MTLATPALAALGQSYASVETDRARFAAKANVVAASDHTIHALSLANGGVTKEFTRSDGVVFAVSWHGPGKPDLRQLLGGYFDAFQSDNPTLHGHRTRRPPAVNRSDFQLRSGGHPGAFWGVALLPQLAPAGFSVAEAQ